MTASVLQQVLHLSRAARLRSADAASDEVLLERYLAGRDEAAFAALLRRHGPMVLAACTRVLGHAHDAEDAFQATFLVLAQKAGSVRPRSHVGSWLHGVALRTAREAQRAAARRRAREQRAARAEACPAWQDYLRPVLDDE